MTLQRLVLLAVMIACVLDLERTWRVARLFPGPLTVLLVTDGTSHEVEGFVRYLYWELTVRNRLSAEIAVEIGDQDSECAHIVQRLLADGFLVEDVSAVPALVFRMQADRTAAG